MRELLEAHYSICYINCSLYGLKYNIMNEDIYPDNNSIEIYAETFNQDFDDVAFEPESIDDSDEEAANIYGY